MYHLCASSNHGFPSKDKDNKMCFPSLLLLALLPTLLDAFSNPTNPGTVNGLSLSSRVGELIATVATVPSRSSSLTRLFSTLSPTPVSIGSDKEEEDEDEKRQFQKVIEMKKNIVSPIFPDEDVKTMRGGKGIGAISMTMEELSNAMGGDMDSARRCWDLYNIGIDPRNIFGEHIQLGYDDFETIYGLLPRRYHRRGGMTSAGSGDHGDENNNRSNKVFLDRLKTMYSEYGGKLEGGVASLSYVATMPVSFRAGGGKTRFRLRLSDKSQVECSIRRPLPSSEATQDNIAQGSTLYMTSYVIASKEQAGRTLTSDEILAQMFFARRLSRLEGLPPITNVEFDIGGAKEDENNDTIHTVASILVGQGLFNISPTSMTLVTSTPTPETFRQLGTTPGGLISWRMKDLPTAAGSFTTTMTPADSAVDAAGHDDYKKSNNSANHDPASSISELRTGLIDALLERPLHLRTTSLEVPVVLREIQDSDADALASFAKPLLDNVPSCNLAIRLIPQNSRQQLGGSQQQLSPSSRIHSRREGSSTIQINTHETPLPSGTDVLLRFRQRLESHGLRVQTS